jgi:integrase
MNRTATVYMSATVAGKWARYKPVVGKNNKIRPGYCLVHGQEYHDPDGIYYVRYSQGGKQLWEKVGPNAQDAVYAAERRQQYQQADNAGLKVMDPSTDLLKLSIAAAVDGYLKEIGNDIVRGHKSEATLMLFRKTLTDFMAGCRKVYVEDITRADLIAYQDGLLKRGLTKGTSGKNLRRLNQWYRSVMHLKMGDGLVTIRDEMKDIATMPEVFDEIELARFFAACSSWEHLVFSVFLESGFRMQEVMYLTWDDVKDRELCVTPKTVARHGFNFTPKTKEARSVPVSAELIARLRVWHENQQAGPCRGSLLVFPNTRGKRSGQPHGSLLNTCKDIGERAGLKREDCWLHKFRATMATRWLRKADLVTVQYLLGHGDIASTQRYLAPVKNANLSDLADAMAVPQ